VHKLVHKPAHKRPASALEPDVSDNKGNISRLEMSLFARFFRSLSLQSGKMKTAVLEFQRNRVRRQQSGAASLDIIKTIVELRAALQSIGKAIEAVGRLTAVQAEESASRPRRSASRKKLTSKSKRRGRVVALPQLPDVRDDQPAVPDSAGAQT